MKVKGNGQGKVLTALELKRLFSDGLLTSRDRCLFAICLLTGCLLSEALSLQVPDIKHKTITFRKSTTKGKLKTRTIDLPVPLVEYLADYQPPPNPYNPYLFPSREGKALSRSMADKLLRAACQRRRKPENLIKQIEFRDGSLRRYPVCHLNTTNRPPRFGDI